VLFLFGYNTACNQEGKLVVSLLVFFLNKLASIKSCVGVDGSTWSNKSSDYETGIAMGSTNVRVGSIIFGTRYYVNK